MSLIGKKLGNYEVVSLIGSGGMGSVYLADHPLIGKKVAVKVLHPEMARNEEFVTRFFHEARAANDIGHPNIVDILDFGRTDDEGNEVVYLLMEFLDGESLKHRMKRKPLDEAEIVRVIDQIACALAASHDKHIVHRDLKPDNVHLLVRGGDPLFVKVLDFGIAKLLDMPVGAHVTRSGEVLGTPEYMSPEQCEGKGTVDGRSDIYSLGCMLYEMLAGKPPFTGNLREVIIAHLGERAVDPIALRPEAHAGLCAIAMRCLEKDPARRFQSMQELREALHHTGPLPSLSSLPHVPVTGAGLVSPPIMSPAAAPSVATPADSPPTAVANQKGVRRPRRRLGWALGLSGALLAVVASAGIVFALARHPRAPGPDAPTVSVPAADAPGELLSQVAIRSDPTGATVTRAGHAEPLGRTPLTLTLRRGEPDFDVKIALEGFRSEVRTVEPKRDGVVLALLMPSRPMAAQAPPAAPIPSPEKAVLPPAVTSSPPGTHPPSRAVTPSPPAPRSDKAHRPPRPARRHQAPGRDDILIPEL